MDFEDVFDDEMFEDSLKTYIVLYKWNNLS